MGEIDGIPYFAVGNGELRGRPRVHVGDRVRCSAHGAHELLGCLVEQDGLKGPSEFLLSYYCGEKTYVAAIDNTLLPGRELA